MDGWISLSTIFLDAGGVILDESCSEKAIAEMTAGILASVLPSYTVEMYYADIEEAVKTFCPNAYQFVYWKNLKPDVELFGKLYGDFRREIKGKRPPLRLSDGFDDEVRKLAGHFDVGIAGQYGDEILELLRAHDILDCFRYTFTQDQFDITKPDPRYLLEIAKRCGVKPTECIMVGDRVDKDIIPAKQVGMKTILIRTGIHRKQEPRIPSEIPDMEITGIRELTDAALRILLTADVR